MSEENNSKTNGNIDETSQDALAAAKGDDAGCWHSIANFVALGAGGAALAFALSAAVMSVIGEDDQQAVKGDMLRIMEGTPAQHVKSPYAGNLACAAQVAQKALAYVDTLKAEFSQEKREGYLSGDTGTGTLANLSNVMNEAAALKKLFDPSVSDLKRDSEYLEWEGADVDVFGYRAYRISLKTHTMLSGTRVLKMEMNEVSGKEYNDGLQEIDTMQNQAKVIQNYSDYEGAPVPVKSCFGEGGGAPKF